MSQDFSAPVGAVTYPPPIVTTDDVVLPDDAIQPSTSESSTPESSATDVAKDQAANVASEASRQAQDLLAQTRTELQDQAAAQQQRAASGIRSLSAELSSMAERSEQSGTATELVRQASAKAGELAGWLEQRDPGSLVQELKSFARRRPGAFLAIAAGAGLAAGRLTRGAVDASRNESDSVDLAGSSPAAEGYLPEPLPAVDYSQDRL